MATVTSCEHSVDHHCVTFVMAWFRPWQNGERQVSASFALRTYLTRFVIFRLNERLRRKTWMVHTKATCSRDMKRGNGVETKSQHQHTHKNFGGTCRRDTLQRNVCLVWTDTFNCATSLRVFCPRDASHEVWQVELRSFPEPRAEVHYLQLNFKIPKLVYCQSTVLFQTVLFSQ